MNKEEFKIIVNRNSCKDNKIKNMFLAFICGGVISLIGQMLHLFFINVLNINVIDSYTIITIIFVITSRILTGLCVFDKISSYFKAGVLVPITGFAHAMSSSAMDNKDEGFIYGIGANMFKLTGSVIVYGIISAFIFALIKGLIF